MKYKKVNIVNKRNSDEDVMNIDENDIESCCDNSEVCFEVRDSGNLRDRGLLLGDRSSLESDGFEYRIVVDDEDQVCLIKVSV
jgi:hypothetical protein